MENWLSILIICCLLTASCGDSPAQLTDSEVLATADAIRAQTPTPIHFHFPEDCGRVETSDVDRVAACDEKLNADYADYISSQATAEKQDYDESVATDMAEYAHYADYESTKMAPAFEAAQEYFASADAGTLEPTDNSLQDNQLVGTPTPSIDTNAIQWNEAAAHVGESALICGPVASTRYASTTKGSPIFINLGVDYPNSHRFTVVIWGKDRANFDSAPEKYYLGKTLCVAGVILSFKGIAEIEVSRPVQLEVK